MWNVLLEKVLGPLIDDGDVFIGDTHDLWVFRAGKVSGKGQRFVQLEECLLLTFFLAFNCAISTQRPSTPPVLKLRPVIMT